MQKIKLTQGKVALVDDQDFEKVNQYKWYAEKRDYTFYARRNDYILGRNKVKRIYMHRFILQPDEKEITDHINRNGLDNRKQNLRIVTPTENNYNQKLRKDNSSGYKNISWNNNYQKWVVEFWKYNKKYYFGCYKNLEKAIEVKNEAWEEGLFKPCQNS